MNNKEMLLEAAERAAEFINKNGYSNFISKIQEVLTVSKHSYKSEYEQKQKFLKLLDCLKNSSQIEILCGGKELKNGFRQFLDQYMKLKKKKEYIVENEDFKDCTIEEMEYILGWTRRLIKENNKAYSKNNYINNKQSSKSTKWKNKKNIKEDTSNTAMGNAFKGLNINF